MERRYLCMGENKLDYFIYCLPYFHQVLGGRCSFGLSDREKYIFSLEGSELKIPVKPGDSIKEGTASYVVINEGREVIKQIDKEVFGVPYIAHSIPLKDEQGAVYGVLTMANPITYQEDLNELAGKISYELDLLDASTTNIAAVSQEFAATVATLAQNAEEIKEKMTIVDSILSLIREISDQTHLLGLNAAIEAARAGDSGRGFNVVAEEIRKLASKTKDSLKQINEEMKKVLESILAITESAQQIAASSEEQAANIEEVGKATHDLKGESQRLIELSQQLIKK
ncbi:MAG: chemotaxis protein [Peptococcaceae bacterium]|nr:chemotaxis protein [Peptococcaceae bacterium]